MNSAGTHRIFERRYVGGGWVGVEGGRAETGARAGGAPPRPSRSSEGDVNHSSGIVRPILGHGVSGLDEPHPGRHVGLVLLEARGSAHLVAVHEDSGRPATASLNPEPAEASYRLVEVLGGLGGQVLGSEEVAVLRSATAGSTSTAGDGEEDDGEGSEWCKSVVWPTPS